MFTAPPRYCLTTMTDCGVNFSNTSDIIFVAAHRVTRDSLTIISMVTLLESGTFLRAKFHLRNGRVEDCVDVCCTSPMPLTSCTTMQIMACNFLNTTIYVSLLSVDCAWFVFRLYNTFIARTNPKTLRGTERALSESALQYLHTYCCTAVNPPFFTDILLYR